MRCQQYKDVQ